MFAAAAPGFCTIGCDGEESDQAKGLSGRLSRGVGNNGSVRRERNPWFEERSIGESTSGTEDRLGYQLQWLGVNGWKIEFDGVSLLVDPWVTRYFTGTFSPSGQDQNTEIVWNRKAIDDSFPHPVDAILLTHGHFDHISDVPLIAANTGATGI